MCVWFRIEPVGPPMWRDAEQLPGRRAGPRCGAEPQARARNVPAYGFFFMPRAPIVKTALFWPVTAGSVLPLLSLSEIHSTDRAQVGGKALHLAALRRARLPVPDAVVIPVAALEAFLRAHGLWHDAQQLRTKPRKVAAAALRSAIKAAPLSSKALRKWVVRLGGHVAVRSSSVAEDGVTKSFAGQHDTVLGVGQDGVEAAVKTCWASLYSDAALAYRKQGPPPEMAVVVQRLVDPVVSGVLFTVNPMNGSWREMVAEATWGLGEGLVSGQVAPHWFLVRRPRKAPRPLSRVLSRVRLQLMQEDLPEIPSQWVRVGDRVDVQDTPSTRRGRRTLSKGDLFRLCRLGLRVERLFGAPQDVEWALDTSGSLHLLQARPITTSASPRVRDDVLWTRRFIGERWPEPATPCGWSLMEPLLSWFIAYPETQNRHLGGGPALRLHKSRPYINASVFRHLTFKLPGAPPLRFTLELIPQDEERDWRRRFAGLPGLAVYGSILRETFRERRWQRFRFNPFTNHLRWDEYQARLQSELHGLRRQPTSPSDALGRIDAAMTLVRDYVSVHVTSLLFANLFYQLLESTLAVWIPVKARFLLESLATCPPGNLTLWTNEALWELGQIATPERLDQLARGDLDADTGFGRAVGGFLKRYGHRSVASWEVFSARWGRHPEMLVPLLKAQAGAPHPSVRVDEQQRAYAEATGVLRSEVEDPLRYVCLRILVYYTRRYLLLRENQRFWFDHLLDALQQHFLWLGQHFVDEGVLEKKDDVAYLTWPEIRGLVGGNLPRHQAVEWVRRRRQERAEHAAEEPPAFLKGDDGVRNAPTGARMEGLGVSPGRVRGKVRVIRRVADGADMQPGDVLVAHAVDPAWTPLLVNAGAIVLELGSLLSHGAVVAREYGVPGVVNIDDVSRVLRDGQEVTVDGTRGVVWVH
jgi:phosphohistidine swiveling domain-containing protein